jgi:3-oxoacyl-[acyl-carrier-protein] synthase-3
MAAPNTFRQMYAHIVGWGMSVPEHCMSNDDISAIVETSDEWIRARTGIRTRYIASDRETTSTLAFRAAQKALDVADILPVEIDMIIVATSTPEHVFPSTASIVQDMLGAGKAGAFDLSAACSGFVYGVQLAAQAIRSGSVRTAVVIGAETMSRVLDWQDRSTCILFGDGAGAVVLRGRDDPGGVLSAVLRSDGSGRDLLGLPTSGSIDTNRPDIMMESRQMLKLQMEGGEVFKFATRVIGESLRQSTEMAGITVADLKLIVPHQANERIIAAAARAMKVDPSLFMSNVEKYGNTSAASIPIALAEAIEQGRVNEGDYIGMVGFGGGLAWGALVVQWSGPRVETRFGTQRRQLTYTWSAFRARLRVLARRISDIINRIRPRQGRLQRLRRNVDRLDEHSGDSR